MFDWELAPSRDFRWDRIVDEAGVPVQVTTVDGARPLTRDEMARIRTAPYKPPAGASGIGGNAGARPR